MLRHCKPGGHYVLDCDAQVLRLTVTGSGPGIPVYACHQHIREGGLVPAAFIGHRHTPPELPQGPA